MGNPLNSFLLIKRMTSDWKGVREVISGSTSADFLRNLTERARGEEGTLKWPSEDDLTGAVSALVRLQDTYK